MKNIDTVSNILLEHSDRGRDYISNLILTNFFPEYEIVYFVNDPTCLISKIFDFIANTTEKNILICQTEECFLDINNKDVKLKISEFAEFYNKNIKLITNSVLDYHETRQMMGVSFRPGILDIISYTDFLNYKNIDIGKTSFHTAFVYQNFNPARDETINFINDNNLKYKFVYIKYPPYDIRIENINLKVNNKFQNKRNGFFSDAPYKSLLDTEWANHISFFTEVESDNQTEYSPCLSEKTFRAMHLMRPALIFGGLNTRQRLQDLGFDTWDWLIDWSFDKESDWCLRSDLFLEELNRLLNLDLNYIKQLLHKNKDKLMYNKNRVLELIENYADDSYFFKAID